jgi:hypothetical protein
MTEEGKPVLGAGHRKPIFAMNAVAARHAALVLNAKPAACE